MVVTHGASRASLSVAFVGQHASGKSTLIGHLRYLHGLVSTSEMDTATQASIASEKPTMRFAWLNDKCQSERERGATMVATNSLLISSNYDLSIVDTPGHKSSLKHAISAAATVDHVVLVVDARQGAYEAGMADEGATTSWSPWGWYAP